jgi:hypothetical protein
VGEGGCIWLGTDKTARIGLRKKKFIRGDFGKVRYERFEN